MGFFGGFESRQEIAAKNKQIRAAEKQAEADRRRQIRAQEKQVKVVARTAQRLADSVNTSITTARNTLSPKVKFAQLQKAKTNICELKKMASQYPYLKLYDLAQVEARIDELHADALSKENRTNDKDYKKKLSTTKKLVKKASECSLSKQCQLLNLPLEVIESVKSGRPEHIVLENYVSSGYIGAYCEGGAILIALKALCLDLLAELNTSKFIKTQRQDACSRYFEAQCLVLNDKTEILLDAMESTSKSRFIQNFIEIYSYNFVRNIYPGLSVEFMTKLYDGVGINILCDIARVFMEDPYSYRAGWPDLTLIRGDEIRFIEVKTSDKLLDSQVKTIQTMRQVLPDAFYVAKVVKRK